MAIPAGSIYYTVDVDKASLQALMRTLKEVARSSSAASSAMKKAAASMKTYNSAAKAANAASKGYSAELEKLSNKTSNLSSTVRRVNADFKKTGDVDAYIDAMRRAGERADEYRRELEALIPTLTTKPALYKRAQQELAKLATIQNQSSDSAGRLVGENDKLDATFDELANSARILSSQVSMIEKKFKAGDISAADASAEYANLAQKASIVTSELRQMGEGANLSQAQILKLNRAMSLSQGVASRAAVGTSRMTGAMNQMALSAQLSRGATSLLTDQIFQISPTVGIMLNSLQYATNGLVAFARAIAPVLLVAGSLIGAFATLTASLRAGSALETALANVRKTTNLSSQALAGLTQSFQATSQEIPIAVSELLDMAQVAGQLGITGVDNIERFANTIARLSIATNVTGEQGATNLARFLQATGTEMENMGREAERVANVLNELENTTAATADEILQMTSYTQGLAAQANFTTEEILGINAALLSLGVKAEAGGSAIVRTMSKIQQSSSEGGEALEKFAEQANMTVDEFDELVRSSPLDALLALTGGMNAASEAGGNLNDTLTELGINEVRERRALLALSEGYDTLESAVFNARKESFLMNSLNKEVQIQSDTLANRIQLLRNAFAELAQDIGIRLVEPAKAVVDAFTAIVSNTRLLISGAIALGTALGVMGLAKIILGLVAVVSKAGMVIGGLVATFSAVAAGTTTLSLALKALGLAAGLATGPVGWAALIATALGGSLGVIYYFRQTEEAVGDNIKAFEDYYDSVDLVFSELARVSDKNELLWAIEAISNTLTGEAKEAWIEYADAVIEKNGEIADSLDELADGFEEIARRELSRPLAEARTNLVQAIADTSIDLGGAGLGFEVPDISNLRSLGGLQELLVDLVTTRDEIRAAIEDPVGAGVVSEDLVGPLVFEAIDSLYEQEEAVNAVIEATRRAILMQRNYDDALEDTERTREEIFGGGAAGGLSGDGGLIDDDASGGVGDIFAPLEEARNRYLEGIRRLEIDFYDAGKLTILGFKQGLLDNEQELYDAQADFLAEFASRTQLADGVQFAPLQNLIDKVGLEEAERMVEQASRGIPEHLARVSTSAFDLQVALESVADKGLEEVTDAFSKGLIDSLDYADRRVAFHTELYNFLVEEYGEFSDVSLMAAEALEEETKQRDQLAAASESQLAQDRALSSARTEHAKSMEILNKQLEYGLISNDDYVEGQIKAYEALINSGLAANMTAEEIQGYINKLDELKGELTPDRVESFENSMRILNDTLGYGIITYEEYLREKLRLLEAQRTAAIAAQATAAEVAALGVEIEQTEANLEQFNDTTDDSVDALDDYNKAIREAQIAVGLGFEDDFSSIESQIRITEQAMIGLTNQFLNGDIEAGAYQIQIVALRAELENLRLTLGQVNQELSGIPLLMSNISTAFAGAASGLTGNIANIFNAVSGVSDGFGDLISSIQDFKAAAEDTDKIKAAQEGVADAVTGIAGAIDSVLPQYDSFGNQLVEGALATVGAIAEMATGIPGLGQAFAAVGSVVSSALGDMSNGVKQVAKSLEDFADSAKYISRETAKSFMDIEGLTKRVSRGGFLGALGLTKQALDEEIFELVKNVATGVSEGLAGALESGVRAAITGDKDWKKVFRESLEEAVLQIVIDAVVNSTILAEGGPFQEFIQNFTRILVEDGPAAAFAYMNQRLPGILNQTNKIIEEGTENIPDYLKIGSDEIVNRSRENIDRLKEYIADANEFISEGVANALIDAASTADGVNQEILNNMLDMIDSITSGMQSALRKGIEGAISGKQDWKEDLKKGMLESIGNAIIDAFIQGAIIQGVMADFTADFVRIWETQGPEAAQEFLENNIDATVNKIADMVDAFVGALPTSVRDAMQVDVDDDSQPTGGSLTQIGEITGPTRDILVDLLRPLSILPSWTSMIQDIRNDVRYIASQGGTIDLPSMGMSSVSALPAGVTNIQSQTIIINNPTITTQAKNGDELYRDISKQAYKDRKSRK